MRCSLLDLQTGVPASAAVRPGPGRASLGSNAGCVPDNCRLAQRHPVSWLLESGGGRCTASQGAGEGGMARQGWLAALVLAAVVGVLPVSGQSGPGTWRTLTPLPT